MMAQKGSKIKEGIRTIQSGGSTALHEAWVKGSKQVAECLDEKCLNRVILMTDGQANEGMTETKTIVKQAGGLYKRGVSTSTIGVGNDFNEDLLVSMARASGGNSWFVEGSADFQRIFAKEMEGLLKEVCAQVSLGLKTRKGLNLFDVLNDFDTDKNAKYGLPNLTACELLGIVLKVRLPGGEKGKHTAFSSVVGWTPQGGGERSYLKHKGEISNPDEDEVKCQLSNLHVHKGLHLLETLPRPVEILIQ